MRRVGKPEVTQGIGYQKMTELVVDGRRRNGMMRQQSQTKGRGQRGESQHAPAGTPGEFRDMTPQGRAECHQERCQNQGQQQLKDVARAEAERVLTENEGEGSQSLR